MGRIKTAGLLLGFLALFSCDVDLVSEIAEEVAAAVDPRAASITVSTGGQQVFPDTIVDVEECYAGSSQQHIFSIVNNGNVDLLLPETDRVVLSSTAVFSLNSLPPTVISPGGVRDFTITFSPAAVQVYSITVTIYSSAVDEPEFSFTLEGEGVEAPQTPVPSGFTASDGSSVSQVSLSWNSEPTADYYQVYRNTSTSIPGSPLNSFVVGASYSDTTAEPGVSYYYWVRAHSGLGLSDFSSYNTGYRKLATSGTVTASQGTSTTYIQITWTAVSGADTYEIYRSTSSTAPSNSLPQGSTTFSGRTGTSMQDTSNHTTVVPGKKIYYWVRGRAASSGSCGDWKAASTYGYKKLSAVSDLSSASEYFAVDLSWTAIPGADSYYIYRALSAGVSTGDLHTVSTQDDPNPTVNTWYYDKYEVYGEGPYYYRVAPYASDTGTTGSLSNEVSEWMGYGG